TDELVDVFGRLDPPSIDAERALTDTPIVAARQAIGDSIDREFGGLGSAPKFPHPASFDRLLRHWRSTANSAEPDVEALFYVSLTLSRMAEGGIYDQLAGGFCRYSVDRYWQIPHFEKMLYDNGPLLALYAQLHIATGEPMFRRIAQETGDWLLREMTAAGGGFLSSIDADSEGEEGRYYVWSPDEVRRLLDADDFDVVARHYGLDQAANFEGHWHLLVRETVADLASELGEDKAELQSIIDAARATLAAARLDRVPPGVDDKQLTAWNALAIRGLAIAARSLESREFADAAETAIAFLRDKLMVHGRLFASHKEGVTRFPAYLDDHAFLLDALLEMLQTRWDTRNLEFAVKLADLLIEYFEDDQSGGFFFTASDAEPLIARPKPLADEAMPSGNGIAAFALQRLGFLLGETHYLDAAERTLRFGWQAMEEYPHGHASMITALEEYVQHPEIIVLRGDSQEMGRWQAAAAKLYAPRRLVFAIPTDASNLPGALADRRPVDTTCVAYRCVGSHCSLPLTSWEALAAELSERQSPGGST
ncbi:MAG: thioredoxin domain-containing protein, partial [Pseudomonadota bacterium]